MQNNYAAYIKVAIFVLFIVGSILIRVVRKLMEEKAKREAAERRRRAQEEHMRTGGIEPQRGRPIAQGNEPQRPTIPGVQVFTDPAEEAKRRLIELARKRREEIEALAREAVGGGAGKSGPKRATGGGAGAPSMAPPVVTGSGRTPQGSMQQQPVRPPKQQKQQKPPKQRQQPQQVGRDRQPPRQPEAPDFYDVAPGGHQHTAAQERESTVHRLVTDAPNSSIAAAAASPAVLFAQTLRARPDNAAANHTAVAELRRAIMLSEILSPPVALRGENNERTF